MPLHIPSPRRWMTATAAGAVALGLAACGGSGTTGTHQPTATSNGKTSQETGTRAERSTTPTATTGGRTSTPTKTSARTTTTGGSRTSTGGSGTSAPECATAQLSVKRISAGAATGHTVLVYAFTNTGSATCDTYGWPGAQFLTRSGSVTLANPTRVTRDFAGSVGAPARVVLKSGGEASFRLIVTDVPSGTGGSCTPAGELEITPPNNTTSLKLSFANGMVTCGSATITPVLAGTAANPS